MAALCQLRTCITLAACNDEMTACGREQQCRGHGACNPLAEAPWETTASAVTAAEAVVETDHRSSGIARPAAAERDRSIWAKPSVGLPPNLGATVPSLQLINLFPGEVAPCGDVLIAPVGEGDDAHPA